MKSLFTFVVIIGSVVGPASAEHSSSSSVAGVFPSFTDATSQDWAELIDQTWGPGLPNDTKLELFDALWTHVDQEYSAYMNLEVDIDAFRDRYRPEIAAGVSRGRFAAIVNLFAFALKDSHTYFLDMGVNIGTNPRPGVPLFAVGAWLDNSRFGACLTPMEDGTLLVYRVQPGHVLGLEPGDLVLGYDLCLKSNRERGVAPQHCSHVPDTFPSIQRPECHADHAKSASAPEPVGGYLPGEQPIQQCDQWHRGQHYQSRNHRQNVPEDGEENGVEENGVRDQRQHGKQLPAVTSISRVG